MDIVQILTFIGVGFIAQLIDGSLGMAYGVCSTTCLIAIGVPPKIASASVHTAEVFTTFVSGISHLKFKNVDFSMLKRLIIPGMIGGVTGAYILINFPSKLISPFVNGYLLLMGIMVIARAVRGTTKTFFCDYKIIGLGLIGGFFDAIGGGGWGPIVTSTLVASGHSPRYTVGSVNTAEFFVTLVQTLTFTVLIGINDYWQVILGLAIGGVIAAPLAAILCRKLEAKKMMLAVGILIVILNIRSLVLMLI